MPKTKQKTVADLKRHFARRLWERYRMETKPEVFNEIIRRNCSTVIEIQSLTRSHHICKIGDVEVYVVYNKKLGSVVTALPPPTKGK